MMQGYVPEWLPKHDIIVEKSLSSKPVPLTILEGILKI